MNIFFQAIVFSQGFQSEINVTYPEYPIEHSTCGALDELLDGISGEGGLAPSPLKNFFFTFSLLYRNLSHYGIVFGLLLYWCLSIFFFCLQTISCAAHGCDILVDDATVM